MISTSERTSSREAALTCESSERAARSAVRRWPSPPVPPRVRQPERFTSRDLSGETFGSDFLEQLARSTPKIRQSPLRRIEEALWVAVPQLR